MSDYRISKPGKLKLKGNKDIVRKSRKKAQETKDPRKQIQDEDALEHGGWWCIKDSNDLKPGSIAIEATASTYLAALDSGFFSLGGPHGSGEGPDPEEILTIIRPPDANWIALKTGYGKYVGVDRSSCMIAVAEAISAKEKWEVIFDQDKSALQSMANNCFLSFAPADDGYIRVNSRKAQENEILNLRSDREREVVVDLTPDIDKKEAGVCEVSYVKLYQHSKVKLNPEDSVAVKKARTDGTLHETLLDRREKMKSDKFCK